MPQNDFYNHNTFIAYPMQEGNRSGLAFGARTIPESALVDAGFLLGIDSTYDELHRVKFTQVVAAAATVTFVFADHYDSATFRFVFNWTDPLGTVVEVDAQEGAFFGEAFLVCGDLAQLRAAVPNGTHNASEVYLVETALVQSLHKSFVKQLTIATQPDTLWHMPAECGGSPTDIYNYVVTGRGLTGHRKFKPGYNALISVVARDNAIIIGAGVGAGEGIACDRIPLGSQSSESMSSESPASSQAIPAPKCKDIFNTINGVWPDALGNFSLKALTPGLVVREEPENHKIIVEFRTDANKPFCRTS